MCVCLSWWDNKCINCASTPGTLPDVSAVSLSLAPLWEVSPDKQMQQFFPQCEGTGKRFSRGVWFI